MTPVTERFVSRLPAPAEREPVSDGILFPVSRDYRNTATNPERTMLPLRGILNDDNGLLQCRLDGLVGLLILNDEPAGWAVAGFFDCGLL